jgi:hypothetical protein
VIALGFRGFVENCISGEEFESALDAVSVAVRRKSPLYVQIRLKESIKFASKTFSSDMV